MNKISENIRSDDSYDMWWKMSLILSNLGVSSEIDENKDSHSYSFATW